MSVSYKVRKNKYANRILTAKYYFTIIKRTERSTLWRIIQWQVPPYTVGPEAYRQIEKQCHIYGKKAVVVGGKKAMAAAKDKLLAAVKDTGIEILDFVWFGGECTFNNAKKLEQLEAVRQADMIFAVGGGKAIDTCKLVSIDFEKPYFSFLR